MKDRLKLFLKFICIMYLILFLPRVISVYQDSTLHIPGRKNVPLLGIENLLASKHIASNIKPLKLGMIIDQFSYDQDGNRSCDVLQQHGFGIKKIVHIAQTNNDQGVAILNALPTSHNTQAPEYIQLHKPFQLPSDFFKNIDGVLVDLQDYALVSNSSTQVLFQAIKSAAIAHKKVFITDRANPLGSYIEGPGQIPLRHGMTLAELATYYNQHLLKNKADLNIIALANWHRDIPFSTTGNEKTLSNYLSASSFLELLKEVQPLKILHNDDFSWAMLFPQGEELSTWEFNYLKQLCSSLGFSCNDHSYWDKNKKQLFRGIKLSVNNLEQFSPFNALITIGRFLKNRKTISVSCTHQFDKIMGSKDVRKFFEGKVNFTNLKDSIEKNLEIFQENAKECLLYEPDLKIGHVYLIKKENG